MQETDAPTARSHSPVWWLIVGIAIGVAGTLGFLSPRTPSGIVNAAAPKAASKPEVAPPARSTPSVQPTPLDPDVFTARMAAAKLAQVTATTLAKMNDAMGRVENKLDGWLVAERFEIHDLENARDAFEEFATSQDADVSAGAKGFQVALTRLIDAHRKSLDLGATLGESPASKLSLDASDVIVNMKLGASGLEDSTRIVTKSLLIGTGTPHECLVLTKEQRDTLVAALAPLSDHPSVAVAPMFAPEQAAIQSSATILKEFLAQPRKAIDDQ